MQEEPRIHPQQNEQQSISNPPIRRNDQSINVIETSLENSRKYETSKMSTETNAFISIFDCKTKHY